MKISESSKKLIEKINDHSSIPLKNIYELTFLLESALRKEKLDEFKDLIFTAKYVNGLKNVLSDRIITGDDFMDKIFDEFNKNLQKFINILRSISVPSDSNTEKFFEDKYFRLDQDSVVNSMELIEDLTVCKEFFNRYPENLPD
ncbi:MAG TPA: hypothetical protein PKC91_10095 [Ignavibacteria bacterium]|nr:hypothetical protein [Ignavibacteria bacterium]